MFFERRRHFVQHAGAAGGEEAFERQRLDALDHDAADHLDGRGRAGLGADDRQLHLQLAQQRRNLFRVRAGDQQRRPVPGRVNGAMTATST